MTNHKGYYQFLHYDVALSTYIIVKWLRLYLDDWFLRKISVYLSDDKDDSMKELMLRVYIQVLFIFEMKLIEVKWKLSLIKTI